MTPSIHLLAATGALVLAACHGGPPSPTAASGGAPPERAPEHGEMMAPRPDAPAAGERAAFAVPPLRLRVERVLAEVGDELPALPRTLDRAARRQLVRAMGPRVRASLRRHDVRPVQLARALHRSGEIR